MRNPLKTTTNSPLSKDLDALPNQPGVYIMKGRQGEVLYVGKAKNLRQRVRQYFTSSGDGRIMIPFLVAKVEKIDTILVFSDKEAILLENTLIKQYKPRYNALLKDDKTYIALKVNHKHPWPMVSIIRYKGVPKPDGLYFGPYTSADAARQTLEFLQKTFPLRECSDQELVRRTRPCILYDMKRCIAPCVNRCTKEEYDGFVDSTIKFLKGKNRELLKELYQEVERAAEKLEFERADTLYRTIQHLEKTLEVQNVDKPLGIDSDAIAIFREGDEVILTQLYFRGGKLTGSHHFDFKEIAEEDGELLATFLMQYYRNRVELPQEILLPAAVEGLQAIQEILSLERTVSLLVPQRGEKKRLVEMAYVNAESTFKKEKDVKSIRERTLLEMQERLHLKRYPRRIECFDNSTISGTSTVSTLVAFTDGAKDSGRYRKYKIRQAEAGDDYGAMREALTRRFKRGRDEDDLPDLLVVDGGKGHLNVARKVLADLNIVSIDLIGLAKEEGRHDKGETAEQIFVPEIKDPIHLKRTSPVLFLLQQIRDEAHRTAIGYHRKVRSKKMLHSSLDDIPGIGPVKHKLLLTHFGSVKKLAEASVEELRAVPGISEANIRALKAEK